MIPFANIPSNLRTPLFYAEVDNSQANSNTSLNQRVLIVGQMTDGTATANIAEISAGVGDAQAKYGLDSMLSAMVAAYRQNDGFGEVWCLPVADNEAGVSAEGTITIAGTPTKNGVINLYIGGGGSWGNGTGLYQIPVTTSSTATTIATAIVTAITNDQKAPVTAANTAGVVTLTAVHGGEAGNDIDIRLNYLGTLGGQKTPDGLTITIVQMADGEANPDVADALAGLGDTTFDFIVCPYTDTASLNALGTFLNAQTGRWAWSQQLYGHYFAVHRGTFGELTTKGAGRNDPNGSLLGVYDSPTPTWIIAAQLVGAIAQSLKNDPGRPLQTLPVAGMFAPPSESCFPLQDRNSLLFSGISTFIVGDDGTCRVERLITTYQKNAFDTPDDSYLSVELMYLLPYVLRYMRSRIETKYSRMKLADNGTRFAQGSAIVTPNTVRSELIAAYQELEFNGYVQDSVGFAKALIVERSSSNRNRLDVLWPGTFIDQFNIFALLAQFRV